MLLENMHVAGPLNTQLLQIFLEPWKMQVQQFKLLESRKMMKIDRLCVKSFAQFC